MVPDDNLTGNEPQQYKCIYSDSVYIIYLANPDQIGRPETKRNKSAELSAANKSPMVPRVTIDLHQNQFNVKWYDPSSGKWSDSHEIIGGLTEIIAPGPGDWVLLLTKV